MNNVPSKEELELLGLISLMDEKEKEQFNECRQAMNDLIEKYGRIFFVVMALTAKEIERELNEKAS